MARGITIPGFKLYYSAIVTIPAWYWPQNGQVDQCNKTEDPDISLHTYEHLIWTKNTH